MVQPINRKTLRSLIGQIEAEKTAEAVNLGPYSNRFPAIWQDPAPETKEDAIDRLAVIFANFVGPIPPLPEKLILITNLDPDFASDPPGGTVAFTLTGIGFDQLAQPVEIALSQNSEFDTPPEFLVPLTIVNDTTATFEISSPWDQGGYYALIVDAEDFGVRSPDEVLFLQNNFALPQIFSITPNSAQVGDPINSIVGGTDFQPGDVVEFSGPNAGTFDTTFIDPNNLGVVLDPNTLPQGVYTLNLNRGGNVFPSGVNFNILDV